MSASRSAVSLLFTASLLSCNTFAQINTDFDTVQITATPVAGNITMLQGSGGNIAVSLGADGVLMVDDQFAPLADKIKAAIRELGGDLPNMGDDFITGGFPFVDLASGGNVAGLISNLASVLEHLPEDITIIPDHGNLATKDDLAASATMVSTTAGIVTGKITAGMSLESILAEGLPEEYEAFGWGFISEEAWITTIYNSTTAKLH